MTSFVDFMITSNRYELLLKVFIFPFQVMAGLEKIQVTKNLTDILENVSAPDLLPYLQENEILTDDDVERVKMTGVTRREKVMTLLNILPNRGPNAYKLFILSLEEDYPWLAKNIKETRVDTAQSSNSLLTTPKGDFTL